jgi:hypothetical protein
LRIEEVDFMKIPKKQLFMEAQYSPGALSPFTYIFLIQGNDARCPLLKIPQISSEDDIRVLFFHVVLSTGLSNVCINECPLQF